MEQGSSSQAVMKEVKQMASGCLGCADMASEHERRRMSPRRLLRPIRGRHGLGGGGRGCGIIGGGGGGAGRKIHVASHSMKVEE
mmetsp:Transcript_20802/g.28649  ORF Transcript_20802/g.28649 Transcript_20802/m.28649 type:complete len:84 (-) Transcript_20802:955-1206(-)|eukprot:scaffold224120_cov26-Tisochrysis_lutea.AAC.2